MGELGLSDVARVLDQGQPAHPGPADGEDLPGESAGVARQPRHGGCDVLAGEGGGPSVEDLPLPGVGDRVEDVHGQAVVASLDGQGTGEADDSPLGCCVVSETGLAVEGQRRRGHDDAPGTAGDQVIPGGCGDVPGGVQVLAQHGGSVGPRDAGERCRSGAIAARIVDQHVQSTQRADRLVHDRLRHLGSLQVTGAADRPAASVGDLVDDGLDRGLRPAVDGHQGAVACQGQGVSPTEPAAGAGDQGDPPFEGALVAECHAGPFVCDSCLVSNLLYSRLHSVGRCRVRRRVRPSLRRGRRAWTTQSREVLP